MLPAADCGWSVWASLVGTIICNCAEAGLTQRGLAKPAGAGGIVEPSRVPPALWAVRSFIVSIRLWLGVLLPGGWPRFYPYRTWGLDSSPALIPRSILGFLAQFARAVHVLLGDENDSGNLPAVFQQSQLDHCACAINANPDGLLQNENFQSNPFSRQTSNCFPRSVRPPRPLRLCGECFRLTASLPFLPRCPSKPRFQLPTQDSTPFAKKKVTEQNQF